MTKYAQLVGFLELTGTEENGCHDHHETDDIFLRIRFRSPVLHVRNGCPVLSAH